MHQQKKQQEKKLNNPAVPQPGCSSTLSKDRQINSDVNGEENPIVENDVDENFQPLDYEHVDVDGLQYSVDPNEDNFDSEIESEYEQEEEGDDHEDHVMNELVRSLTGKIDEMTNPVEKVKESEKDPLVQQYLDQLVKARYQGLNENKETETPKRKRENIRLEESKRPTDHVKQDTTTKRRN